MKKNYYVRKNPVIPFTEKGYQEILDKKAHLLSIRPKAIEDIQSARAKGDLSENSHYKSARANLSSIDARLRKLERLIKFGKVIKKTASEIVDIGKIVTITDGVNKYKYTIVGGYESDPKESTISYRSPLGKALMGKRIGDKVRFLAPKGRKEYDILELV